MEQLKAKASKHAAYGKGGMGVGGIVGGGARRPYTAPSGGGIGDGKPLPWEAMKAEALKSAAVRDYEDDDDDDFSFG